MAARDEKRPPDFKLQLKAKDGESRNNSIGSAWRNSSGGISINLHPGIVLTSETTEKYWLTLWPLSDEEYERAYKRMNSGKTPPPRGEDDIPF
jgi:hypothetical protein